MKIIMIRDLNATRNVKEILPHKSLNDELNALRFYVISK